MCLLQPIFFFFLYFSFLFVSFTSPLWLFRFTIGMATPVRLNLHKTCAHAHLRKTYHIILCAAQTMFCILAEFPCVCQFFSSPFALTINGHYHVVVSYVLFAHSYMVAVCSCKQRINDSAEKCCGRYLPSLVCPPNK